MKLAVISDIHGNLLALQAVLADIRSAALTRPSTSATSSLARNQRAGARFVESWRPPDRPCGRNPPAPGLGFCAANRFDAR